MISFVTALALAAAPAPVAQRDVEQAIFEDCPSVMDGALALDDSARIAAAGYEPVPPRQTDGGPDPQVGRGSGAGRILISGHRDATSATCAVWFGGPDNAVLLRAVRRRARAEGFRGGNPMRLGDGTPIQLLTQRQGARRSLTIIEGNAGGDLDFEPVTTVITMSPH